MKLLERYPPVQVLIGWYAMPGEIRYRFDSYLLPILDYLVWCHILYRNGCYFDAYITFKSPNDIQKDFNWSWVLSVSVMVHTLVRDYKSIDFTPDEFILALLMKSA